MQLIQPHPRTMKKTLLAILGLAAVSLAGVNGQVFTGNYTFGSGGNVTSFAYNGTPIDNLTVSALTKNGVTNTSSAGNFRASNWPLDPAVGILAGSIDTAKYFEFSLTPTAGNTLNINSFTFGVGRTGTGPRSFQWRSSLDSFAAPISGYTATNAALDQNLGAGILSYTSDVTTAATGNTLTFSSPTFSNLSTVTFRLYGFNSEGTTGTGGLEGNFIFAGEVVPEPTTWALIGLGAAFVLWRIRRRPTAG
jgi:hypothetical protein